MLKVSDEDLYIEELEEYPRKKNTNLLKPVLKGEKKNNVLQKWIKEANALPLDGRNK